VPDFLANALSLSCAKFALLDEKHPFPKKSYFVLLGLGWIYLDFSAFWSTIPEDAEPQISQRLDC
jgi:hypothetical protein